jgi:two-component system, cell cycle sensor histidine kinase and response regulator CckA
MSGVMTPYLRRRCMGALTGMTKIRILFLEDNVDDAQLCLRKLKGAKMDFDVDIVSTRTQFQERADVNAYDIVLADFRLPDWNGLEAVRWLRGRGAGIPFILVTGSLGDEVAVDCIREGATDYILKEKLDRLPLAVFRALEEKQLRAARDQATYELRQSEEQYSSIIKGAPYGIFRSRDDGTILLANPSLVRMLGYDSVEELLATNMTNLYWDPADRRRKVLPLMGEPGVFRQVEVSWKRRDGKQIIVKLDGRKLPDGKNAEDTIYEVFVQDLTEQRTLEREFQQAQKMEAIGRLAGGVAHDFNNLLMIIRGCAELLEHYKNTPEKSANYLRQINDATSIAASVVQQLMAFSRKQVPERSMLDLNVILKDLGRMLPRLLGEDISIHFTPGANLERITADRSQIEQIILNLAVNARDAMPDGGELIVETANADLDVNQIKEYGSDIAPGRYVVLSIADTGVGMDIAVQSHIFEPFFTTKERGKGTGLGLATVYGIVKQTSGMIMVESTPGVGTSFRMYFPVVPASGEQASKAAVQKAVVFGSETILLVEDEAALREITQEYLQSIGYQVLTASNGMLALDICRSHQGPIELLLTDIIMPGVPGPEVVKSALTMRPDLKVIYVSGYTDRGVDEAEISKRGIFLRKPYSLADLGRRVREVLTPEKVAS